MSYDQNYSGSHINAGNGASFGSGRAGSYNTARTAEYGGDTFKGPITGGNVGGRENKNVINNNDSLMSYGCDFDVANGLSDDDDVARMQKEKEDLEAKLAAKKAGARVKQGLARDVSPASEDLESYQDCEEGGSSS